MPKFRRKEVIQAFIYKGSVHMTPKWFRDLIGIKKSIVLDEGDDVYIDDGHGVYAVGIGDYVYRFEDGGINFERAETFLKYYEKV